MNFNGLISALSTVNRDLREQTLRAVNISLTLRNWFFGYYILEFEQNGNDRAEYGQALLPRIADEMSALNIPNTDERELRRYRQFYVVYPNAAKVLFSDTQIAGTLSPQFRGKHIENIVRQIRGALTPELDDKHIDNSANPIRGSLTPESNDKHIDNSVNQIRGTASPEFREQHIDNSANQIRRSLTAEFAIPDNHYINLFKSVSYTHFAELLRIDDPLKRLFYELECVKGTWSVRELKRQMGSLLFERTGLSANKEKLLESVHKKSAAFTLPDIIRDPYVFEFLGLKPKEVLPEEGLEQALIDHLLQFLLELGKGFCFEARQKRVLIDNEHHFIDLVFYHRLLHCNVLIDLKTERFNHAHAGQLNMYVEYYKKYEMHAGDNPPVGILLCTDKGLSPPVFRRGRGWCMWNLQPQAWMKKYSYPNT